ncbi:hypothetical protein SAMN04489717_2188 [Actinopolymorpha singaporensis]|uniref:Uncharacterized protein n=1 Tax=Actinopolymorpha singaporensis TaxID=117157 RepID=A0A1H1QXQ3_9ACTN|nr:hypothetical protein SAMN04489717_2188 [Actinopolymorpha singaporensis]
MSGVVESYDKGYVMAWVRARMAPATVHMYGGESWPET